MKKIILFVNFILFLSVLNAQGNLQITQPGGSKKASVSEWIGLTEVTIQYHRPAVRGREGKIWGTDVAFYGTQDMGFTGAPAPWRAGANENTTISFSTDVTIEGKYLPAGRYGVFMQLGESENLLILSKFSGAWGNYFYNPADEALRVVMRTESMDKSCEYLQYEFIEQTAQSARVALSWEKKRMSFEVAVDLHKIQIASFKEELRGKYAFEWQSYNQAAKYCADNNVELELGLKWAEQAINLNFVGEKNFQTLSTKAAVLRKMDKKEEAEKTMMEALPLGSEQDVHQYGRSQLAAKELESAYKVFMANYDKHPNTYTTNMGMARALSAKGEFKKSMDYLKAALPLAPEAVHKTIESYMKTLEEGKDFN